MRGSYSNMSIDTAKILDFRRDRDVKGKNGNKNVYLSFLI